MTWNLNFLFGGLTDVSVSGLLGILLEQLNIHFLTYLIATSFISFQQAFCMQNVTLFSSVSVQGFFSKHMWESLHTKWSLQFTTCCSHWPWHPALICGSILSLIIEYISTWVHRALSALFPLAEEGIHPQIYIPSSHNSFTAFVDC